MSEVKSREAGAAKFSLGDLLIFTALIAFGVAVGLAYQRNRSLTRQRAQLLAISSRLQIKTAPELASTAMPNIANNFHSWHVHVPEDQEYELRLGIGEVSEKGIPPVVGSARIAAGQHRVTLHVRDTPEAKFHYVVYIDGIQVIEKMMGSDWFPQGWSSAQGLNDPHRPYLPPAPLQLYGQSYDPKRDFGPGRYFNGQWDDYVTRRGYRLWIDHLDQTYQPASPFIGFADDSKYHGVGLRDGIRYQGSSPNYEWTFTRPQLATSEPILRIEAEFFAGDGTVVSSGTPSFQSWQFQNASGSSNSPDWQESPAQETRTALLRAVSKSVNDLQPVVEMRWEEASPDAIGIRLADVPANDQIKRWRLRIFGGYPHLWRELQVGERPWLTPDETINSGQIVEQSSAKSSNRIATLRLEDDAQADVLLKWQTNEKPPLQIIERSDNRYSGLRLYQGLPLTLSAHIPAALKPTVGVEVKDQHPSATNTAFPGGPVIDAIQFDFESDEHEWIELSAESKE